MSAQDILHEKAIRSVVKDEIDKSLEDFSTVATAVEYDNTSSDLTASDVQAAIDEVDGNVDELTTSTTDSLALKAPLESPTFTGTPVAPTASLGTDTTQVATTAFTRAEVAALVNSAPSVLDTLGEIATALQSDESAATALATTVAGKTTKTLNLSDLTDVAAARTNLGLGSAATHPSTDFDASGAAAAAAAASVSLATYTTKGDLVVATGSGAVSRLGVGTNGKALVADSSQATGLAWATVGAASPLVLIASTSSETPLILKGAASQSVHLLIFQTSGSTQIAHVNKDGKIYGSGFKQESSSTSYESSSGWTSLGLDVSSPNNLMQAAASSHIPLVVKGAVSQSADLHSWQNSAGSPLAYMLSSGKMVANDFSPASSGTRFYDYATASYMLYRAASPNNLLIAANAAHIPLVIQGAASQSADLQQLKDSGGSVLSSIDPAGLNKWSSGNEQTTVGAAGGASALPASPTKYLKVKDSAGTTFVVPAFAAA